VDGQGGHPAMKLGSIVDGVVGIPPGWFFLQSFFSILLARQKSLSVLDSPFFVQKLLQGLQGRGGNAQLSSHHLICSPVTHNQSKMLGIRKNREKVFAYVIIYGRNVR
jgi:hypothetical protein